MTQRITVILSRNRAADSAEADFQSQLKTRLGRRGEIEVFEIPHLYDLALDGSGAEFLRSIDGEMIVVAGLYPRSSSWILRANEVAGRFRDASAAAEDDQPLQTDAATVPEATVNQEPARIVWCLDPRPHDGPNSVVEAIDRIISLTVDDSEAAPTSPPGVETVEETVKPRWYPVIDFDRCNHCLECLNFCLFGVFGVGVSDEIIIEEPNACRAGCPACSRICPQGAIIFPQHADPAIAGDAAASLESLKLDLSQLFAGINPAEMATTERDRALAEQEGQEPDGPSSREGLPGRKDDLDDLVDELDDMEL